MIRTLSLVQGTETSLGASRCEHRAVSKDGRVFCRKIVEGENAVTPDLCRTCPFRAVNCKHLRFSLLRTSPSPLLVRFNGQAELWNDDPPEVRFRRAGCSAQIVPIEHPSFCSGCSLHQPVHAESGQTAYSSPDAPPGRGEAIEIQHAYSALQGG